MAQKQRPIRGMKCDAHCNPLRCKEIGGGGYKVLGDEVKAQRTYAGHILFIRNAGT